MKYQRLANSITAMSASDLQVKSTPKLRSRKGTVCVGCRQQKLKCDAASRTPSPCSRCAKIGIQCSIDPSFRALERQLQSTTSELERYKSVLGQEHLSTGLIDQGETASFTLSNVAEQTLDNVRVNSHEIVALVDRYYSIYNPQFPILPEKEGFLLHYDSNKLLLWTVLAIASYHFSPRPDLYSALVDPVRRLAGDLYHHQSRGLDTVQGLILLSVWPFPYQQTVNDPSPMYVALATNIAQQIGLHRPQFPNDFQFLTGTNDDMAEQRERAWYGCFIVNHILTMRLGIPSSISSYHAVMSELAKGLSSTLPPRLRMLLHLSHIGHKAISLLGNDSSTPHGLLSEPNRLIEHFDHDLYLAYESFGNAISVEDQVFFSASRLHLYSFAFNDIATLHKPGLLPMNERAEISTKAISEVKTLINLAQRVSERSNDWPAFLKNAVVHATSLGAELCLTSKEFSAAEIESLLENCEAGRRLIQSWSLFAKDNYSRYATHIATFFDVIRRHLDQSTRTEWEREQRQPNEHRTRVLSRMSANILYNVLWSGKARRTGNTLVPTSHSFSEQHGNTTSSDIMSSLPEEHTSPWGDDFSSVDGLLNAEAFDIFADWQGLLNT